MNRRPRSLEEDGLQEALTPHRLGVTTEPGTIFKNHEPD